MPRKRSGRRRGRSNDSAAGPAQQNVVNTGAAASGSSGPAPSVTDSVVTSRGDSSEQGSDANASPPSTPASSVAIRRLVTGLTPEAAESTGDVAERDADNFSVLSETTTAAPPASDGTADAKPVDDFAYPPLEDEAGRLAAARERDRISAYRAGGIRFAPWNIPYRRRLQTLAVLLHSLSIAALVSFFFFLCAIPLTWPLLIPYLLHMLLSKSATDGRLRARSERLRRSAVWGFFGDYFPARLHKTHDLPADRKYIFGYHPHGIISHGAFAAFATEALGFSAQFPGLTNSLLTLDSNFRIPLYRDYILAMGIQSVSKESITNILTRGGRDGHGTGRAVTIVIGGARESLEATPGVMHLVLAERKGFVKVAMRTGADLVPVLAFGENDLYDQVSPKHHPLLHALQMWVLRTLKFTLPFLHGRGIFNYDVGLMPYRRPLNIVVGRPIATGIGEGAAARQPVRDADIDVREINRVHGEYVRELERMWEAYKDVFARGRREEMQILK